MDNLLLKVWEEEKGKTHQVIGGKLVDIRSATVEKYAFGIPNKEALNEIALHQPILEIGAGLGYWSRLLQDRGVQIRPTDLIPPDEAENPWTKVFSGTPQDLLAYPGRTPFLCWLPESNAQSMANFYQSETILWVGEPIEFPGFRVKKRIEIPQWDGFQDALLVFEKSN